MLPPGAQHSDEKGAKEIILDDDECPLQIFREWPSDKGSNLIKGLLTPDSYMIYQVFTLPHDVGDVYVNIFGWPCCCCC